MDITNLILLCGENAVSLQPLDSSFIKFDAANSRNPTRIQFGTDADVHVNFVPGGGVALKGRDQGLVLWLPREKVAQLVASQDWEQEPAAEKTVTLQLTLQEALSHLTQAEQDTAKELLEMLNDRIGKHGPL